MTADYLIDGYNLLHAMGILHSKVGPHELEKARRRLLGLLSHCHAAEAGKVTVVFDAAIAPPGSMAEQQYRNLYIHFAVGYDQADDLIESFIRQASAPRQLHVVSDDRRIQRAARRRHCPVLGCNDYLDSLRRHRRRQPSEAPEKEQHLPKEETAHWLKEFADLENDPDWKELSDPFGFQER
jgi:predicted RNA-binding protein with PIN domain